MDFGSELGAWRETIAESPRRTGPRGESRLTEDEIARVVVDACYRIHTRLGPGLMESVYEAVLARELGRLGLQVRRQIPVPIVWEGLAFDEGFRADLIVEDKVIVELKSVEKLAAVHGKQLLTYLRLTDSRLGLLVNLGATLIKDGIKRVVNGLEDDDLGEGFTPRRQDPKRTKKNFFKSSKNRPSGRSLGLQLTTSSFLMFQDLPVGVLA